MGRGLRTWALTGRGGGGRLSREVIAAGLPGPSGHFRRNRNVCGKWLKSVPDALDCPSWQKRVGALLPVGDGPRGSRTGTVCHEVGQYGGARVRVRTPVRRKF